MRPLTIAMGASEMAQQIKVPPSKLDELHPWDPHEARTPKCCSLTPTYTLKCKKNNKPCYGQTVPALTFTLAYFPTSSKHVLFSWPSLGLCLP